MTLIHSVGSNHNPFFLAFLKNVRLKSYILINLNVIIKEKLYLVEILLSSKWLSDNSL